MVLAFGGRRARTFGRYSGVRVDSAFAQQVLSLDRQGIGTVAARAALRTVGFRFRDSSFNAVRNEARLVATRGLRLRNLRLDARPGANTLTQTNREFSRNFQYTAQVQMIDPITGAISELPVSFGDDRLLTKAEIIERAEAIAEQVADKGGIGSAVQGIVIGSVRLTSTMARAPR